MSHILLGLHTAGVHWVIRLMCCVSLISNCWWAVIGGFQSSLFHVFSEVRWTTALSFPQRSELTLSPDEDQQYTVETS